MTQIPIFTDKSQFRQQHNPFSAGYYAFYSSWFGGIVTDPALMLIPIDDHMAHRGDAVFEAIKTIDRSVYLLDSHLDRLFHSAEKIGLSTPYSFIEMKEIILATLRVANRPDTSIRIFLSRGPGNFSVNPYDSVGAQLYIVITELQTPPATAYIQGVKAGKSVFYSKPHWLAQIKSCNYLLNVLMKKEAVDRQLDFIIGFDEEGYTTESATENIMIVDTNGNIAYPPLDSILKGTTMTRACELAEQHGIKAQERPIAFNELVSAREAMITGTSLNVLPVVEFEGHRIGTGKPGVIAQQLQQWMLEDIAAGQQGTLF